MQSALDRFMRNAVIMAWQLGYQQSHYIVDVLEGSSAADDAHQPLFVTKRIEQQSTGDDPPPKVQGTLL